MRVLLVAGVDPTRPGGLETHVRELARALAARGHEIAMHGPWRLPPFPSVADIVPARHDIVHHHGGAWPGNIPTGAWYVRTLHWCTAAKVATYVRLGRVQTLANPGNWAALAEERATVRRAGRLIAVSDRLRREFAHWYRVDPARVRVIPNGVRVEPPARDRAAVRAAWSVAPEAPVLLTIGRADFVKGWALLERAWRRAALPRGAVWVSVGGHAPQRTGDRLVTGPQPHAEVADWIAAADLGALPSWYEGCGVALLEMLAGGLYTLAHDVGIAPEVVRPGASGELVAPDESAWAAALARLLASPPPRGPGLPPGFTWDAVAEAVEQEYRAALAGVRL
ncbi:MAG TPA: glycosyltransferase family 4 protein [Candidatus Eisenbacteria bacterium]|nr:glycosyltransferase family 4 protein [Candidatus Eisenbacteria bacterium]